MDGVRARIRAAVPVVLDVLGVVAIVAGVFRLEGGGAGWWLVVLGIFGLAAGFATQDL